MSVAVSWFFSFFFFSSRRRHTRFDCDWSSDVCSSDLKMALDSAGLTRGDVDMVVCGTAPDAFDGGAMKGEYLLDGSGGYHKPYTRVFTGGGTGVFSTIAGWGHGASGPADGRLVVNGGEMS